MRKAEVYRAVKAAGFNKKATKEAANDPSVDDDIEALRQYLVLLCGPEAASAMKDESHFGEILFGAPDTWPSEYVDAKHGAIDQ